MLVNAIIWIGRLYAAGWILWLILLPLLVYHMNLIPFAGLILGPPVMALISLALICGLLFLLCSLVLWPLAPVFAWLTWLFLAMCNSMVETVLAWPGSHLWVGSIPLWWVILFYSMIVVIILFQIWEDHRKLFYLMASGWLLIGLVILNPRRPDGEMRVTFLSVGHGGCTVIELPDGRTLMYDVGSLRNPDLTRRVVAPYLWHRGIRRIDELYLSHADFDHYGGAIDLVERFRIGKVLCNPTFAEKENREVKATLDALASRRIPVHTIRAGQRRSYGDVSVDVLHPPNERIGDSENARSLVLLFRHAGHRILLTGDLAEEGLTRFLRHAPIPVEVLMAPHHGSRTSNTIQLAKWASPRVVISSEGFVADPDRGKPYEAMGAIYLSTWKQGAITIRSHATGLIVETQRKREVVRSR